MKHLISVYAWAVGGLYFILFSLITICLTFFLHPKTYDPWLKKSMRLLFKLLFIKVSSEGSQNIDPDRNYLFMSNHQSMFDIPLFEAYIPTLVRGIEAQRQFKWPVYGWLIRRLGNIPIDRKSIYASVRAMKKTEEILKKGKSIIILPEGHRTLDGKMRPFKKLPFHLAKQAGVPIVPMGISGLFQLKHKGSWLIKPRPVKVTFGQPIEPEEILVLSTEELRDCIRKKIEALLQR
jgi:1-acyl-sn-glycerol-3-phosphate acyltransferase